MGQPWRAAILGAGGFGLVPLGPAAQAVDSSIGSMGDDELAAETDMGSAPIRHLWRWSCSQVLAEPRYSKC